MYSVDSLIFLRFFVEIMKLVGFQWSDFSIEIM